MVNFPIDRPVWEGLTAAEQERISRFLEEKDIRIEIGGKKQPCESEIPDLDLKSRSSSKDAYEDLVDKCDKLAQIIYEGCCDSGKYTAEECAAHAAAFFDHCCTVYQP